MTEESVNDNNETSEETEASTEEASVSESAEPIDEVTALTVERDTFRETAQRLQADFENYRKRMLKQQSETAERANEALVQRLLPVLDTVELAKAHEPSSSLEQISTSLLDVLLKEGLERIDAVGEPFDPTLHEAVAHEAGEGESRVTEELRAGYRWKGRVVRPAMVKVTG